MRSSRAFVAAQRSTYRSFSIAAARNNQFEALNKRTNDTSEQYRKFQMEKNLNPHMTNTTSTIANEMLPRRWQLHSQGLCPGEHTPHDWWNSEQRGFGSQWKER
jgi:hypothetical protein